MLRGLSLGVLLFAGAARADSPSFPATLRATAKGLEFKISHTFERTEARERVRQLLHYWKERFGVVSEWSGDHVLMSGRVYGVEIIAALDVTDGEVVGVARDPGFFWRGQAHSYVEGKLKKYLNPSYQDP
jgi:hypothetical protein